MKTMILLTSFLGAGWLLGTCQGPATPPPAVAETWIDAPLSGSTISLAPYTIIFHGTSVMGLNEFEVSIDGELVASVAPETTESGGSQGTLFMADYEWHPPDPGVYQIGVRAKDQNGFFGPEAHSQVTVASASLELLTPEVQPAVEQLPTGLPELELAATPTPTLLPQGVGQPEYSVETVYYRGLGCGPKQTDIQIRVPDPSVYSVVLFVRLEDIQSGEKTDWISVPMVPLGNAYYGYSLVVEREQPEVFGYESAHLQVQIVATDSSGKELGRTAVDSQVIVQRCSS